MSWGDVSLGDALQRSPVGRPTHPGMSAFATEFGLGMLPGAGLADAAGALPALSDPTRATHPGIWENVTQNGLPGLGTALLQGLGAAGDGMMLAGPAGMAIGSVLKAPRAAGRGIRAFHGTPHDFDRFDIRMMGTGEGAQSYGPGLYFSENEAVARAYRDTLSNNFEVANPDRLRFIAGEADLSEDRVMAILREASSMDPGMAANLRASAKNHRHPEMARALRGFADMADLGDIRHVPGRMYEVDINARPEQFLDWDRPLAGQTGEIQRTLGDILDERHGRGFFRKYAQKGRDPQDLLNNFDEMGDWGQVLSPRGVKGTRYLDAGSRPPKHPFAVQNIAPDGHVVNSYSFPSRPEAEQFLGDFGRIMRADSGLPENLIGTPRLVEVPNPPQTHNYAVFDDSIIEIVRKYGLAGLLAAGLLMDPSGQPQPAPEGDI
jgi:hypothetical protein